MTPEPSTSARQDRSGAPLLRVREVSTALGGRTILDKVSFDVAAGEVTVLLGANGVGKSTLCRLAAGVTWPDSGTVTLCGYDTRSDADAARARVGYVPDVGGLVSRLTGLEHIELASRLRGLGPDTVAFAQDILHEVGIDKDHHGWASTYSKGMSRKLSVALALMSRPPVLILDEPFDGVDSVSVDAICVEIRDAVTAGAAAVVTTHQADVAERLADTILLLRGGGIAASVDAQAARRLRTFDGTGRALRAIVARRAAR